MPRRSTRPLPALARGAVLALMPALASACGDGTGPVDGGEAEPRLAFSAEALDLDTLRAGVLTLRNEGDAAGGPVELRVDGPLDAGGGLVGSAAVRVQPEEVATLAPGASVGLQLSVSGAAALGPGEYSASVRALLPGGGATATVRFRVLAPPPSGPVSTLRISGAPATVRQGDVVRLRAVAEDSTGTEVSPGDVGWMVSPPDAGLVSADGRLVAYRPGPFQVTATVGAAADTVEIHAEARGLSGGFAEVGRGPVAERYTSDLWLHGVHAYSGTWGMRTSSDTAVGNTLYAWRLEGDGAVRSDSVRVDARTVNDVKVRTDGRLAVITHEGSSDARNGVTLLDLVDPAHPRVIGRYTQGLESGVHNVWVDGDYVYLVVDGVGSGLRVLDVSRPDAPKAVASFYAGTSFLHDVYVRDGLAFLSHWNAGLVILDVGSGLAGGSPANPVELGRLAELGGQTHNAWYWPEAGYVFVGEEDFGAPGIMHVVDVRDPRRPREVARFGVPGDTPHNFWLDEDRGILYLAWYENGLRALDVSGELMGDLGRQGREIASSRYGTSGGCPGGAAATCTWAPQLHDGRVWVSDMNNGLVALQPSF